MEFRTLVKLPTNEAAIKHADRVMLLGSCFAENIGTLLVEDKFQCDVNPWGILYNPCSIIQSLNDLISQHDYMESDLFFHQGLYHSFSHHGSFSAPTSEACLKKINSRLFSAREHFEKLDWLLITLGTAYTYKLKSEGRIVANCHKLPDEYFERNRCTVESIVKDFTSTIEKLLKVNPKLRLLFTVSPIRHVKDGMHENQLSKSTLLLAIDRLKHDFPELVFYFPSYELLMDELRDYRFYADDMLHPSTLAVQYLWEGFKACYFPEETMKIIREWNEIKKALSHKPFHPESMQYKLFLSQIVLKIERLKEKCPYLDVEKELELCHIL